MELPGRRPDADSNVGGSRVDRGTRSLIYDPPASLMVITTIAGDLLQPYDLFVPAQFSGEFLQYAIVFFVLAIIAAAVGARDVASISMEIARIFVIVFLVLAVLSLIL